MSNGKSILCLLLCLIVGFLCGLWLGHKEPQSHGEEETREVFIDTISIEAPELVDVIPVRVDTVTLPVVKPKPKPPTESIFIDSPIKTEVIDSVGDFIFTENPPDSATVEIPIAQHEYADSTYHLLVSGYHVSVDELTIYPKREVVTIKQPPKHWHLGISVGYGITPRGFEPTIAATVTYSIFSF